jgi:acyl dehydratase
MKLKDPTFEAVEVGETFGPLRVDMDDHYVKAAMFAVDDYSQCYMQGDAAFGGRIAPSTAIAKDMVALFTTKYDGDRIVGLHTKEEVWFHRPIPFGTTLFLTGRYVHKERRRGKGYVVLECEARDAQGTLYVRQISTEIMRVPDKVELGTGSAPTEGQRVAGVWPADCAVAAKAQTDTAPGTPIPQLVKRAHQDQLAVFSGWNEQRHSIHTEVRYAQAAGFRDSLAQGMMETCWMSEMLANFFGPSWLSTGWVKTSFLKPVYRNDELILHGVVTGRETKPDGTWLTLEVWARNQDGAMTAAGWASAHVA